MLRYLLSRLISLVLSLAVASLVIFAMLEKQEEQNRRAFENVVKLIGRSKAS